MASPAVAAWRECSKADPRVTNAAGESHPVEEIHVAFDGRRLVIRSNVEEVTVAARQLFGHMMASTELPSIGTLCLLKSADGFTLDGPSFKPVQHSLLAPLQALLKEEVRTEFMRNRPDLLWLHAGGVEMNGMALLLAGPSGQGKSTFTTLLCAKGWRLLSDDVVPISMQENIAYPFPQLPSRRLPSDSDWTPDELGAAVREPMQLPKKMIVQHAVPIGEMVFPVFLRGSTPVLQQLTKGETAIEILRASTNFCDHRADGVTRAAVAATSIPAYRLTYGSGIEAVTILETLRSGQVIAS